MSMKNFSDRIADRIDAVFKSSKFSPTPSDPTPKPQAATPPATPEKKQPATPSDPTPKTLVKTHTSPVTPAVRQFWNTYSKNCASLAKGNDNRYALYIGYLYECKGWHVDYTDYEYETNSKKKPDPEEWYRLICRKGDKALIIQCRAPVKGELVHLSLMYQLIASTLEYKKDNHTLHVGGMFCTTSSFSDRAKNAAQKFNIFLKENFPFSFFPYVKCKAGINGQNVHYTPYDEEYFHTDLDSQGDMFCWTEQEAIDLGFQHG